MSKLLNILPVSKFRTKKWVEFNVLSSGQYSVTKNIRSKFSMLRSDLYNYSHVYIFVKRRITIAGIDDAN